MDSGCFGPSERVNLHVYCNMPINNYIIKRLVVIPASMKFHYNVFKFFLRVDLRIERSLHPLMN